jgi:UPF0716 family protein affecting phage T7 exclusion
VLPAAPPCTAVHRKQGQTDEPDADDRHRGGHPDGMRLFLGILAIVIGFLLIFPGYTAPFGFLLMLVGLGIIASMAFGRAAASADRVDPDTDGSAGSGGHAPGH